MYEEIFVEKFDEKNKLAIFKKNIDEEEIHVIVPIDYYGQPIYQVRKNTSGEGFFIKGRSIKCKPWQYSFYQNTAFKNFMLPLQYQMA